MNSWTQSALADVCCNDFNCTSSLCLQPDIHKLDTAGNLRIWLLCVSLLPASKNLVGLGETPFTAHAAQTAAHRVRQE